jgi:hypothetical protein
MEGLATAADGLGTMHFVGGERSKQGMFRKFERVLKPFDASSALRAQSTEECDEC